jgi:hypothetical protein
MDKLREVPVNGKTCPPPPTGRESRQNYEAKAAPLRMAAEKVRLKRLFTPDSQEIHAFGG